eukprot:958740-Pelagomonas_calceolata.AAC.1
MEEGESERSGAWRPIPQIPISSVEGLLVRPLIFVRGSSLNARGLGAARFFFLVTLLIPIDLLLSGFPPMEDARCVMIWTALNHVVLRCPNPTMSGIHTNRHLVGLSFSVKAFSKG